MHSCALVILVTKMNTNTGFHNPSLSAAENCVIRRILYEYRPGAHVKESVLTYCATNRRSPTRPVMRPVTACRYGP